MLYLHLYMVSIIKKSTISDKTIDLTNKIYFETIKPAFTVFAQEKQ